MKSEKEYKRYLSIPAKLVILVTWIGFSSIPFWIFFYSVEPTKVLSLTTPIATLIALIITFLCIFLGTVEEIPEEERRLELTFKLYYNHEKCKLCDHKCCKIYDNDDDGIRDKSMWFDEWCENFHINQETYGVEPLFDPLDVHRSGNEDAINELLQRGINPQFCQFVGLDGCRIPWDKRPLQCKTYKCDSLTEEDMIEEVILKH